MKNSLISLMILAALATGCGVTSNQSSEQRAASLDNMAAMIESGNYVYTIQSITPTGHRTIQSTTPYTMKVVNGNYEASLPYFGRAYQASYGGDGGIEFSGTPEDLKITRNTKKNSLIVTFSLTESNDKFNCTLQVGYSGYATLIINSQNRQSISYYGVVTGPEGT